MLSIFALGVSTYFHIEVKGDSYKFNSISLGENYKDLLISILTIVTIFIALLTTVETLIISLTEHKTIQRLKKNIKAYTAFIRHLFVLTICNIILVLLCLGYIFYDIKVIKFDYIGISFLFSMYYSIFAFLWVEFLFFLMIKNP